MLPSYWNLDIHGTWTGIPPDAETTRKTNNASAVNFLHRCFGFHGVAILRLALFGRVFGLMMVNADHVPEHKLTLQNAINS